MNLLQNPIAGQKRLDRWVRPQRTGLQTPGMWFCNPLALVWPTAQVCNPCTSTDLGARACRPTRLCLQPGVRASPYRPGLGRPSVRCLQPGVATKRVGLPNVKCLYPCSYIF
jgi:hypothetical protein